MTAALLGLDEVRFINLVAARRVAGDQSAAPDTPNARLEDVRSEEPPVRAAQLAAALARPGALAVAALPTALLAVVCQLRRDGLRLIAPQGVAAGMIRGLSTGRVGVEDFAAWLADRAISA
ncbi:MAG TPA: hypothetical protein VF155_03910 [Candidatus Dormibacteraeota bacterium]